MTFLAYILYNSPWKMEIGIYIKILVSRVLSDRYRMTQDKFQYDVLGLTLHQMSISIYGSRKSGANFNRQVGKMGVNSLARVNKGLRDL